jgi:hypothetical protein
MFPERRSPAKASALPVATSRRVPIAGKAIHEAIAARPMADLDRVWANGLSTGGMFTRIAYEGSATHREAAADR